MATAGQVIENPVTGERVKWHVTSEDSGGALVRFELWCAVGGGVRMTHRHQQADERFEVLGGTLVAAVDGATLQLRAGDRTCIPAGSLHSWWNGGTDELHVMIDVEPAQRFETLLETAFGLARDGKVNRRGEPGLLQLAVLLDEYGDEIGLAGVEGVVMPVVARVLAPLARLAGRRPRYARYSGPVAAAGGAS